MTHKTSKRMMKKYHKIKKVTFVKDRLTLKVDGKE